MGIMVKDNGIWKDGDPHVKDNGIWKPVDAAWVKDAGIWKETYSSGWVLEGSWETGLEGWEIPAGSGFGRVTSNSRTGDYSVSAYSKYGSEILFSQPGYLENKSNIQFSVYANGVNAYLEVWCQLGQGDFERVGSWRSVTASFAYYLFEIDNPELLPFKLKIRALTDFRLSLDDWKIEGTN